MKINNETIKRCKEIADELHKAFDCYASVDLRISSPSVNSKPTIDILYYASKDICIYFSSMKELESYHKGMMETVNNAS